MAEELDKRYPDTIDDFEAEIACDEAYKNKMFNQKAVYAGRIVVDLAKLEGLVNSEGETLQSSPAEHMEPQIHEELQ